MLICQTAFSDSSQQGRCWMAEERFVFVCVSCELPLTEIAMRFTKVYQVRKALAQPWDGERPNDTVLGLCAYVRKEMRGSWPLSPAKWDLRGRDPVSFRLDTNSPMCVEKIHASWKVENLSKEEAGGGPCMVPRSSSHHSCLQASRQWCREVNLMAHSSTCWPHDFTALPVDPCTRQAHTSIPSAQEHSEHKLS